MKKNIIDNLKIIHLQSDTYYVEYKLEESIPKGIIVYYPLVSFIYVVFDEKILSAFLTSFFLNNFLYIKVLFFAWSIWSSGLFNKINELGAIFRPGHGSGRPEYLKCKINQKHAVSPSKIRERTAVKKHLKCGLRNFLILRFVFRKSFLFSHPPPKTQNSCQQWHDSKNMKRSYKYK